MLRKQSSELGVILGQTEERNTTSESRSEINTNQMFNRNTYTSCCSAPRLKVNVHSKFERIWQLWICGWQLPPPHHFHRTTLKVWGDRSITRAFNFCSYFPSIPIISLKLLPNLFLPSKEQKTTLAPKLITGVSYKSSKLRKTFYVQCKSSIAM